MRLCEEHRVQHWRVPFLGLQAIPPELTDFEIRYFFSYTAKERAAIFSRYGDTTWKVMSQISDALKNPCFEIKGLRK
jgi:hypothetical protein